MLRRRNHATNLCLRSTFDTALEIYRQLTLGFEGESLLGIDFVEFPAAGVPSLPSLLWRNELRSSQCYICFLQFLLELWGDSRSLRKYESPEEGFDMMHMDPTELTDSRPNDGPVALWRNKIVLGVHHDGAGAMPTEWKIVTDRLVLEILFGSTGVKNFFEVGYTT